jgi:hypothetical protein
MFLPVGGAVWWVLGFPPVSVGMLVVLAAVVVGGYSALVWLRGNL